MKPKWKDYYYSMEEEVSKSENTQGIDDSPWKYSVAPTKSKLKINSPSIWQSLLGIKVPPIEDYAETQGSENIRSYFMTRDLLKKQKEERATRRRAKAITQVDKSKFIIRPSSIEDFIFKALFIANNSLHINAIITAIEGLGWTTSSKYHKYAQVRKALRNNDYMFLSMGKSIFKLRQGFGGFKPLHVSQIKKERKKLSTNHIISLREMVIFLIKNIKKGPGVYPGQIHQLMNRSGFNCSYTSIYNIMQGKDFIKDGFLYSLNDLRNTFIKKENNS